MQMTRMEQGAYFSVSAKSSDEFNTALMGWIPEKKGEMAHYKIQREVDTT